MQQEENRALEDVGQRDVHILVIRFSSIGDIVLCTPVFRLLKNSLYGRIHVHFLTKDKYAALVSGNPNIDYVHTIIDDVREIYPVLDKVAFDYVIDLHNNFRSSAVKQHLRAAVFTVDKYNLRKMAMVYLKRRTEVPHIVERYIGTLKAFGITDDGGGLEFYPDHKDGAAVLALPESHSKGFIVFAIGGTYATKRLPERQIAKVCDHLKYPVVLLGSQDDTDVARYVETHTSASVYNACGRTDIAGSAALLDKAMAVITHDTGMMHIAAALGRPLVVIWGNTVPGFGMEPWMKKEDPEPVYFQVEGLRCRPCGKLGYQRCPKKHFHCMERIDPLDVADAANTATDQVSPRKLL